MKTKWIISVIGLLIFLSNGLEARNIKGNGEWVTRTIEVGDYNSIEFGKGIKTQSNSLKNLLGSKTVWPVFNYSQKSNTGQLEILLDENLFEYLDVQVKNSVLSISAGGSNITPTRLVINGQSDQLTNISLLNGVDFNIVSPFTSDMLKIDSRKGGDVRIKDHAKIDFCFFTFSLGGELYTEDLHCTQLNCKLTGGSNASLKGSAANANLTAKSGSDIKADGFIIKHAVLTASGGSDMYLHVTEMLEGNAAGGGVMFIAEVMRRPP